MEGISRRGFLGWTAWTALGVGARGVLGAQGPGAAPPADTTAKGDTSPALRALDAFVERHRKEWGLPGLTLGLAGRQGTVAVRTYGHADIKTGLPLTPQNLFEIGSISKSFVGLTLLQLREEGKLDLNRPVREYLPWLRIESQYAPITVHHLLTHSSGLPGPLTLPSIPLWTAHAPGEQFHYCNMGYYILGLLIETLDKRPLRESLRTRVLQPLGMTTSEPVISQDIRPRLPVSYWPLYDDRPFQRHGPIVEAPYLVMDNAAGCIASTPGDMALYMRMLLNRGRLPQGRLISEESFALFTRPAIAAPSFGEKSGYGYGIAIQPVEGRTLLRHTGGMVSFSSALQVDLDAGFGAFASVNASLAGYRPNAVAAYALSVLRAEAEKRPLPPMPALEDPYKVTNAADYAGTYTSPEGSRKLVIVADGELLKLMHEGEAVVLERVGPDDFYVSQPALERFPLSFGRMENGTNPAVIEVSHGGDWYAGERYTGPRTFEAPSEWRSYAGHYRNEDPWAGSFFVVVRKGRLWLGGDPLVPLGPGLFRIGEEEHEPNRIRFEDTVNGKALRAVVSGTEYRRVET
ncbi:MAG TPA: serine hydrolase [Thermoanaerobaculia bacterium]|jgi:CubicO group peptidase (beta-lactamase class C family)|nr:serine hydrolase [Thermoanaerobaculia bacterium]